MEGAADMKAMLERYADRLTQQEQEQMWEHVLEAAGAPRRTAWREPALATALAAAAAFAFVLAVPRPALTPLPAPVTPPVHERIVPEPRTAPEPVPAVVAPPQSRALQARRVPEPLAIVPAPSAPPSAPVPAVGELHGRILDAQGQPVPYANVLLLGSRIGALTDEVGQFSMRDVPAGAHDLRTMAIGYNPTTQRVSVEPGQPTAIEVSVGSARVVKEVEAIEVRSEKRIESKYSTTKQSISGEQLLRGGRSGEVRYRIHGITIAPPTSSNTAPSPITVAPKPATPARPPVLPITGGSVLPNDEPFDAMFFKNHGVNPFIATDEDALSTFAVDVDAASYTVARRYLGLGHLPPADAIRVEEFVNFFAQGYPRFENEDFRILLDGAPSAFGAGYHLLRVGLKGREVLAQDRATAHLTFVIDISGSMAREDRLELVKRALTLLVDELRPDDRVGIVVYGSQGRVLLEPTSLGRDGDGRERILAAIGRLHPDGATNAEEGIRLGYEMARRGHTAGHIHRIILCSDGVANVGRTGPESILKQVRSEADRGIALTTIGFGMGNYNDRLMEQLADQGDGNHYYVDDIDEAQRVFVENLTGTLQTIAKDAKVQVEFDSTRVLRYRLIGFENRDVADRDFRNDRVDAGEIGAGHEVTALYEVKLAPGVTRGTLATVRLRYAKPESADGGAPRVTEIARTVDVRELHSRFEQASPYLRRDAAVAEFAEILRGSYWARESHLPAVLAVARSAAGSLRDEASRELVRLVEKAASLRSAPGSNVRDR